MLFLGYEEKRVGIFNILLIRKKGKERKPVKIKIKVIMKSSKHQFSCYMTFFGNFAKNGLYQAQAAARHEIITDCPRGITISF